MRWDIWGRYFFELLLCLPAALLCLAPVRNRLRVSERAFVLAEIGAILLFAAVGAAVLTFTRWPENVLLVPCMLVFFALYCMLVQIHWLQALFIFLTAAAIMGFCGVFTDVLLARQEAVNAERTPLLLSAAMQLGIGVLAAALFWPLMQTRVGWLISSFSQLSAWRIVWLIPLAHLVLFIAMTPEDYRTVLVRRIQPLGAVLLLFLLALMAFLIEFFYRIAHSITESVALREENHFLAAQANQYAALNSYIQETRRLRHDFRQHLRVLNNLAAQGDLTGLKTYLQTLEAQEQEELRLIFANPALNALAGYYDNLACTQGIAMEWHISLPGTLNASDAELCVLLGNLLENAIEGAMSQPEGKRNIRVICQLNGDLLCLIVENSYDGHIRYKDGRFLSTKHEGEGYGLTSVRATVERHQGSMSVDTEGELFRVNLLLNLIPKEPQA